MYRLEIELDKKVFRQKFNAINKLMSVSVNQEILNLDKMADSLHEKLDLVRKTLKKKGDVKGSSRRWSEMLEEARGYIDFLLESYCDLSKNGWI